jgi:hypothetical protein
VFALGARRSVSSRDAVLAHGQTFFNGKFADSALFAFRHFWFFGVII